MSDVIQNTSDVQSQDITPEQNQPQSQSVEPQIDFEGQKVSLSEIKKWRETHGNAEKWKAENTRKAQENAQAFKELQAIREWREKNPNYETVSSIHNIWNQVLEGDPKLQSMLQQYFQENRNTGVYQQLFPQSSPFAKELDEIKQKLASMDAEKEKIVYEQRINNYLKQQKEKDPSFNEKEWQNLFDSFDKDLNAENGLYDLIYYVLKGKNVGKIVDETKKQTIGEIQSKKTAAIETGTTNTARQLPQNKLVDGNIRGALKSYLKENKIPLIEEDEGK